MIFDDPESGPGSGWASPLSFIKRAVTLKVASVLR